MKNIDPTSTAAWEKLSEISQKNHTQIIKGLFGNPHRFDQYSIRWKDILVDFSKNRIDEETFKECAENAKSNCPISKALNLNITLDASLEG